jgi:exopolyphosphatase/guanosine-5'-triphosphate,3'-diphosphate pyrophosphatase
MRIATIDIGTNTVLLLVAEESADGELVAVEEHATITRLGENVDRTRALADGAILRTKACLDAYAAIVNRLAVTRVAVVGTSAMRDAKGGDVIRAHVNANFGVEARVISGDEEARLTFAGALSGLGYAPSSGEIAVFDIGGGSTEIVRGTLAGHRGAPEIAYAHSFDVGSVRMTERHVKSDPPTPIERAAITRDVMDCLASLSPLAPGQVPVAIAGTMTTLAAVALRMESYDGSRVHGHRMATSELHRVVNELAALPLEKRQKVTGLEPKRADVIVAGGLIALAVLEKLQAESVVISDRGVRWGLAVALQEMPATL